MELTIATNGAGPYKSRLRELFRQMITPQQMGSVDGWQSERCLIWTRGAKDDMREAVKTYLAGLDTQLNATPFGVPPSLGTWGGSGAVVGHGHPDVLSAQGVSGRRGSGIYASSRQLHSRHAPGLQHVLCRRRRNGLQDQDLQQQPRGQRLHTRRPSFRATSSSSQIFPECIDDFGFLWFEDEAVVAGSASWVVAGNAADAITRELK